MAIFGEVTMTNVGKADLSLWLKKREQLYTSLLLVYLWDYIATNDATFPGACGGLISQGYRICCLNDSQLRGMMKMRAPLWGKHRDCGQCSQRQPDSRAVTNIITCMFTSTRLFQSSNNWQNYFTTTSLRVSCQAITSISWLIVK